MNVRDLIAPPYSLPTWKEVATVLLVVALARGWYDERRHSRELLEIGTRAGAIAEECRTVTGARLTMLTERIEVAEDRASLLRAWITGHGIEIPANLEADQ